MTDMIEVKTADLAGLALDWAVAFAEFGREGGVTKAGGYWRIRTRDEDGAPFLVGKIFPPKASEHGLQTRRYEPAADWNLGGPLIEKHTLNVRPHVSANGVITSWAASMTWPCDTMPSRTGPTMLIAACRAIVMKELGAHIMVPKELVP